MSVRNLVEFFGQYFLLFYDAEHDRVRRLYSFSERSVNQGHSCQDRREPDYLVLLTVHPSWNGADCYVLQRSAR